MPLPCFEQASAALLHSCYHFFQQQFYDPGRTRTCNLWFRRPTSYPLGHRTSWNTGSRPLQLQNASFTRTSKIRNVPMKNYGGPCMWHWFSTWKMTPFLGQSWPFCQIASIKGLAIGFCVSSACKVLLSFFAWFSFWFILHFHVCVVFGCSKKCLAGVVFGDLCCSGLVCQNLSSDGGCH